LRLVFTFAKQGVTLIPSENGSKWARRELINQEAPLQEAPSWLLAFIDGAVAKQKPTEVIPFPFASTSAHSVLLIFARKNDSWICDFYATQGDNKIAKTLTFRTSEKVVTLVERGGALMDTRHQLALFSLIEKGQGRIVLNLTKYQYEKLLAA
jgi:hypothetical protein